MARHELHPAAGTVTDVFDPSRPPVLTVAPGDTVTVGSLDASGFLTRPQRPGDRPATLISPSRGHCLTGPVEVTGARPGMALAVHFTSITPAAWGWTASGGRDTPVNRRLGLDPGQPSWLLWDIDAAGGTATSDRGHTVPIAPFLGVTGVPPAEPGEHSTIPPRPGCGGNIDCRELTAGTTLHLPVTVPGARLCLGDGHAAQGDGEVSGTAIECAMTTEVRLDLVEQPELPGVHARGPAGQITFGFHENLNEAMGDALDAMITWMQAGHGLDRAATVALASSTVHLRVTQVANGTWGVHALLPAGAIVPSLRSNR